MAPENRGLYPTLTPEATTSEIDSAEVAEILELNHFHTDSEAVLAVNGTLQFMFEDPEYAFMNDSEVFEFISGQSSDEQILEREWDTLESAALRSFLDGKQSLVRAPEPSHPRQEDSVA